MRSRFAIIAAMLLAPASAPAQQFDRSFAPGYELLHAGDVDGALESFLELKTARPDSGLVDYSIASALYEKGIRAAEGGEMEPALKSLGEARSTFEELKNSDKRFLRENAPFASANSAAQVAKLLDPQGQYQERVEALQTTIHEYDGILEARPDHRGARTNRNHLRLVLKEMLQQPPPPEERAEDGEGDEGEGEEQQQEDGQEGDEPNEQEQDEGEQGEQEQDESQDGGASDQPPQPGEPQDPNQQGEQQLDDENIEALLESLEEENRQEQKNLRKARGAPKIENGKWW